MAIINSPNRINKNNPVIKVSDSAMQRVIYMATWECIIFGHENCDYIRDCGYFNNQIKSVVKNVDVPIDNLYFFK